MLRQAVQARPHPAVPALALTGVTHGYRRGSPVVRDVTMTLSCGEVVALLGRSGCGKSTLLHVAAGLARPWQGEVQANGEPVAAPSPRRVLMLQQPALYPWMSALDNAAVGLRFGGLSKAAARDRAGAFLEMVHLGDFAAAPAGDLSGGQQQRVALARALAVSPDVLLLDEPFSALDVFTRAALQDEVRRLAAELGVAVLMVTHDIEEAALMADRVFVLADRAAGAVRQATLPLPVPRGDGVRLQAARSALAGLLT